MYPLGSTVGHDLFCSMSFYHHYQVLKTLVLRCSSVLPCFPCWQETPHREKPQYQHVPVTVINHAWADCECPFSGATPLRYGVWILKEDGGDSHKVDMENPTGGKPGPYTQTRWQHPQKMGGFNRHTFFQLPCADHWHPCNGWYFLDINLFCTYWENSDREAWAG